MNKFFLRIKYIIADLISSVIVWLLFLIFRWIVNDGFAVSYATILVPAFNFYTPLFVYPIACITVYYLSGFYVNPHNRSYFRDLLSTFVSSCIIVFGAFFAIILDDVVVSYQQYYTSLCVLLMLQFLIAYVFRLAITLQTQGLIRKGNMSINIAVVGTNTNAQKIAKELIKNNPKYKFVGFIETDKMAVAYMPILGTLEFFSEIKEQYEISSVVVALQNNTPENELYQVINQLYPHRVDIQFTPRIYEILTGVARINRLDLSPLVNITQHSMSDSGLSIKRALDIIASVLGLIVTLPLILVCAICIKRETKGPVFYKQERIGLYGKPFNIIKFRTMYIDAEKDKPCLSRANDDRVTRIGHWLRKYRIDEVPQFWNILIGDMSLVGPRPERKYYIEQIEQRAPYYCLLYKIRPGLTSWGPIKIGYSDTIDKMIERLNYDIIYMDNMSLLVDLKILFYTIEVIIKGKGQ